ncbi:Cysteine/Histidine-rich C1 domain family protein [Raphanus sativus]|nr:Cysteine/Histidine-rich C1 domain family protein [Raphanus sativus]
MLDDRFPYACDTCGLSFHKDCAESLPELNYSCHPKHSLKRLTRVPSYTNGKCCLCKSKLHLVFYHCSICNFSVDVRCARNPPPLILDHPKAHEHQLTLLPRRTFVCDACGMDDDPNPYICLQCNFMVHRNCIDIPHIIKVSRHVHRISYNDCLKAGDWKCEVCLKEIIWTCGVYSCSKCPDFAIHMRCVTRFGIWDGIELESILEDATDTKAYQVIEEGVITHFIHKNHTLKLKEGEDSNRECRRCTACTYPIFSSLFYDCTKCAYLPKKKIDPFYKMSMTLASNTYDLSLCDACQNYFEGFVYTSDNDIIRLDVRCGSISEPFVHEGHPDHSLYVSYSTKDKFCNACGDKAHMTSNVLFCQRWLNTKMI